METVARYRLIPFGFQRAINNRHRVLTRFSSLDWKTTFSGNDVFVPILPIISGVRRDVSVEDEMSCRKVWILNIYIYNTYTHKRIPLNLARMTHTEASFNTSSCCNRSIVYRLAAMCFCFRIHRKRIERFLFEYAPFKQLYC